MLLLASAGAQAKPIAYRHGNTATFEYGPHHQQVQVFHSPDHRISLGGGWLRIAPDEESGHSHGGPGDPATLEIGYLRGNVLARRWNGEGSQANVYFWGGIGLAEGAGRGAPDTAPNAGFSADWETLRWYASAQSDWHSGFAFTTGTSTVQFGVAPYVHAFDGLATWIVLQGQSHDGDVHEERSAALLLRFFWQSIWLEAGADQDGRPHGMVMLNF